MKLVCITIEYNNHTSFLLEVGKTYEAYIDDSDSDWLDNYQMLYIWFIDENGNHIVGFDRKSFLPLDEYRKQIINSLLDEEE